VSSGAARSTLLFGDREVGITELTVMARFERRLSPRVGVGAGVGALVGGGLSVNGVEQPFAPGLQVNAAASALLLAERPRAPFVLLAFAVSYARGQTSPAGQPSGAGTTPYRALDARLALAVGKTVGRFTLYAAGRVFGGPVSWQLDGNDVAGTDKFHRQAGLGLVCRLPRAFDFELEGLALGEQSAVAALGWSF
jgi:hypothetical protein